MIGEDGLSGIGVPTLVGPFSNLFAQDQDGGGLLEGIRCQHFRICEGDALENNTKTTPSTLHGKTGPGDVSQKASF